MSSKLLAVLGCFDIARPVLSSSEIAELTDLPHSTARRLIAELLSWGGLIRLEDGRYQIGIRLWTIGSLAPQQRGLREAALPFMHDLFQVTQENVQLMVLDGIEALCIEKLSSVTAIPISTHVGGHVPLHTTSVGKVILAFSPADLLTRVVGTGLPRWTRHTMTQPGRLAAAVTSTRQKGVGYSCEEMGLGVNGVAAPILGADGQLVAALGIACRSTTPIDRFVPAARAAALAIGRAVSGQWQV